MTATMLGCLLFSVFGVMLGLLIGYLLFGKDGDEQ